MHLFISLLMLPLAAWCAPNPQGNPPLTTIGTASSLSTSSLPSSPTPSPTPLAPAPVGGALTPSGKQEVIRTNFMNHDNKNISATVEFKCNPTQSSLQLKDVEALSTHYLTKSRPLITIPEGGMNSCVSLEEKKDVSAAKLEACASDVKLMYPEVGRILQKFLGVCRREIDGTKYVGGAMNFMTGGEVAFSVKVNKA